MRAVVHDRYGPPALLRIEETARPAIGERDVLVRVRASSVNPAEWHMVRGTPLLVRAMLGPLRPRSSWLGTDFAGVVEAAGPAVTRFRTGDEVFGGRSGAFAEYLAVPEDRAIGRKPGAISWEQAGCVGIAGATALQALRERGGLQPGQSVLINGGSGGVGSFAVQIAKALGGAVTAVCSSSKVDLVRSLGADRVVDYTKEDFTRLGEQHDLLVDVAGGRSWRELERVLKPGGTYVPVGGRSADPIFGGFTGRALMRLLASRSKRRVLGPWVGFIDGPTIETLRELMEAGKLVPAVERVYPLDRIAEALAYLEAGHATAKVAISVS